jgi:hypothetical protein
LALRNPIRQNGVFRNGHFRRQEEIAQPGAFAPLPQEIVFIPAHQFILHLVQAEEDPQAMTRVNPIPEKLAEIRVIVHALRCDKHVGVKQVGHDARDS